MRALVYHGIRDLRYEEIALPPCGDGDVRVRIRATGIETLSATLRRKLSTPEADTLVLEASLSFEVAR